MTAQELMSLAERVERATGADAELGRDVLLACGYRKSVRGYFMGPLETWTAPSGKPHFDDDDFRRYDPTASLDAAMSLRPKGWTIANIGEGDDGSWWVEMREGYLTSYGKVAMSHLKCASAALALCAAALRARASSNAGGRG